MKTKIFVVIALMPHLLLYPQTESIQRLQLKSPEAAAFEKAGEIPVDIYTGVPNISIPIYTVKSGDIELPITLDYHATAIQVDQEATWVGLNWLMNAGGVITTQVAPPSAASVPKEEWRHVFEDLLLPSLPSYPVGNLGQFYKISGSHETSVGGFGYNRFPCVCEVSGDISSEMYGKLLNEQDGEAPLYFANFMGHSVKFIWNRLLEKFIIIGKDQQFKIDGKSYPASGLTLTDGNGIKYEFYEIETIFPQSTQSPVMNAYMQRSVSFYLTKIVSPTGSTINLTYKRYGQIIPLQQVLEKVYINYPGKSSSNIERNLSNFMYINNPYLYEITSDDAIVRFNVGSRIDLKGDGRKLDDINIYTKTTNKIVKKFKFTYSYFTGNDVGGDRLYDYYKPLNNGVANYNNYYNSYMINNRLKLESLQEISIDENNIQKGLPSYQFGYTASSLPAKTSSACDYWGNYNGIENSYGYPGALSHTMLVAPSRTGEDIINGYVGPQYPSGSLADRRFNPNTVDMGLLSFIKYPTGGFTSFVYEPHQFTNFNYFDVNTNANPTFNQVSTMTSEVNSTIPPEYTSPKEFTLTKEMELEFNITVNKPPHYSWKQLYGSQGQLFIYSTITNPNGGAPIESQSMYKSWVFSDSTGLDGKTFKNWTEKLLLPAGKYKIQAIIPFPQIQIYANFPGACSVSMSVSQPKSYRTSSQGCGVRIKSIIQNDNEKEIITEYNYKTTDGYSTGVLMSPVKFARQMVMIYQNAQSYNGSSVSPPQILNYWLLTSNNMIPVRDNKIGYNRVEVKKNGKTVYEFWNQRLSTSSLFEYDRPLEDPRNGNILKEFVYNVSGQLLKETENIYTILNQEHYYLNAVVEDAYVGNGMDCYAPICGNSYADVCHGRMLIYLYPSSKFWIELTNKTEKDYIGNDAVVNTTDYTYNQANLMISSVQKTGRIDGETETSYYIYPTDYKYSTTNYPATLINKNILNLPMEIVNSRKKSDGTFITSGVVNLYNDNGQAISNYRMEINAPLSINSFKFSNKTGNEMLGINEGDSSLYSPFSQYTLQTTCQYSTIGKPVYINERDAEKTVYLWSYSSQYPIAEIKNATFAEVEAAAKTVFSVANVDSLSTLTTPNEAKLQDGSLQKALPNAQVTTYTYKPLIGMATMTNPQGIVTYYDYDAFGRLKETYYYENNDTSKKRIVETYDYHYKD